MRNDMQGGTGFIKKLRRPRLKPERRCAEPRPARGSTSNYDPRAYSATRPRTIAKKAITLATPKGTIWSIVIIRLQ